MTSIKIAIASKKDKIREFFRLEALRFDFSVDCFDKIGINSDFSCYDLAIIDIDTIVQRPLNSAKKELTLSEEGAVADLLYPIDILKLQELYRALMRRDTLTFKTVEENDLKIIFYKDKENIVSIKDKKYLLSDTEYKLLDLLCKNSPNTILREDIDRLLFSTNSNIADVYICKLRKKLEDASGQRLIFTVRSKGYKIIIKSEWR